MDDLMIIELYFARDEHYRAPFFETDPPRVVQKGRSRAGTVSIDRLRITQIQLRDIITGIQEPLRNAGNACGQIRKNFLNFVLLIQQSGF